MGRDKRNERRFGHWTQMIRHTMEEPAWRALSTSAQSLYVWLKFEWRGTDFNNNGQIRLSVRQAAERLGVGRDAAANAFRDLQAKGFIVQTELACLGIGGAAKSPAYEITELKLPHADRERKLFQNWQPGKDFPVQYATANNPRGANGRQQSGKVVRLRQKKIPSRKS
ncbi:hypothetical protein [Notoacmeibacter ruber]|uniref:hypothetical protein n=1 Tax=Notoacmeibacter ruber TaxID=2670375 RepID=UPI0018F5A3D9|nr:hypothetical protein [Notoacmeibacter ruber]